MPEIAIMLKLQKMWPQFPGESDDMIKLPTVITIPSEFCKKKKKCWQNTVTPPYNVTL